MRQTVLHLLQQIGYPQNAPALSALVQRIASSAEISPEEEHDILATLIQIGPVVLSRLLTMMNEDEEIEELVYDALTRVGTLVWEQSTQVDERIVHALASHAHETLDFLLYVLTHPLKEWWDTAVLAIREVGYPQNASALPTLMMTATDPNTPGAREAIDYLHSLDADVVVPHFLKAMLFPEANEQYTEWYTTCVLLHYMDQKCLYACGPGIVFLLHAHQDLLPYQLSYLVSLLEILGSDCAFYALPALLNLLHHEGIPEIRQRVWHLIHSFGQHFLLPYNVVLTSLKPQVESENG